MSVHIVDDEQRRDRPQCPCALWVPGGAGASAALAHRVGARVAPSASHGTVLALFAYGSSGWRVITPVTGRFTTSWFPAAAQAAPGR